MGVQAVGRCDKTSYLGSINCEQRKTEIAILEGEARDRLDPEGVRQATNSTGKSTRNEELVELTRLEAERRTELRPRESEPQQQDFERLNARVAQMNRRLERLEHPNLWDRFKAIWHGGVDGAKRVFNGKRIEALQEMDERNRIIEDNINLTLEQERGHRWEQAKQNVQNAGLQQQEGQNVNVQVNNDLVLTPEKLGIVEPPPGNLSFSIRKPSQSHVEDGSKSPVLDEQSLEEPKPELSRKESVRKLLKGHDDEGDNTPKVTNEPDLELDNDSVRSHVDVKKTDPTTQKGQTFRTQ